MGLVVLKLFIAHIDFFQTIQLKITKIQNPNPDNTSNYVNFLL